jgi:hypothetical protein
MTNPHTLSTLGPMLPAGNCIRFSSAAAIGDGRGTCDCTYNDCKRKCNDSVVRHNPPIYHKKTSLEFNSSLHQGIPSSHFNQKYKAAGGSRTSMSHKRHPSLRLGRTRRAVKPKPTCGPPNTTYVVLWPLVRVVHRVRIRQDQEYISLRSKTMHCMSVSLVVHNIKSQGYICGTHIYLVVHKKKQKHHKGTFAVLQSPVFQLVLIVKASDGLTAKQLYCAQLITRCTVAVPNCLLQSVLVIKWHQTA